MVEKADFISRNEVFGKTVFDTGTFDYFFMDDDDFEIFRAAHSVKETDNTPFFEDSRILYAPIRTYFDITLGCNLRCKTCLNESGNSLEDELNTEESLNVVEGIKKDGVFSVKFSGGEPTQKDDWFKIMSRAKELGLVITMNSNGIYSSETLEKLIGLTPSEITISLDGFGKHNDIIRGRGSFEKATRSIKALSDEGIRICINTVVTDILDETDIRGLLGLAEEYCYDISFFHARPIGRAIGIKDKLLSYQALNNIMKKIDGIKGEYTTRIETRSKSLRVNSLGSSAEQFGLMIGGSDGFTRFNIMPDGKLYAGGCVPYVDPVMADEVVLGNIKDENYSISNIWRNSLRLWEIRELSHQLKKRCDGCADYQTDCSGFTLDMELFRKVNKENPYCRF